jgi:hypothetical protein
VTAVFWNAGWGKTVENPPPGEMLPLQTNSGWFFSGPYRDKIKGIKRVNNLFVGEK